MTGTYNAVLAGTELRAVVYRPAVLNAPAPLVMMLHGNHAVCGRAYNPPAAGGAAPPQAKETFRRLGGAVDHVGPVPIIANPGVAGSEGPFLWTNRFGAVLGTRTIDYIKDNKLDPGGLPNVGLRLDFWLFAAAPRGCPAGTAEVLSNQGYEYLGRRLASQGYVVVSIDANLINNQGNSGPANDRALIGDRGTLILRHMQQLSDWTRNGGGPPTIPMNSLDLGRVALVGHSRGGEATRAAYNMYFAAGSPWPARIVTPVSFDAIFEIGPTDFLGMNASGATWNVLLPMCDADVTGLDGIRPFDRMMRDFAESPARQKSSYTVWGANHNFYNTQWMVSDTFGLVRAAGAAPRFQFEEQFPCRGAGNAALFTGGAGSANQRLTALSSVPALIRGNLGGRIAPNLSFNQNFNTLFALPANVSNEMGGNPPYPTRVDRGYSPTARLFNEATMTGAIWVMEDFDKARGINSSGQANDLVGIVTQNVNGSGGSAAPPAPPGAIPNHDPRQRVGYMQWPAMGAKPPFYFQANWTAKGTGRDITGFRTLDFRVSRNADALRNPMMTTDFSIQLVGANGATTGTVRLSSYTPVANDLRGPVGGGKLTNKNHPILQTYRIPLTDFSKLGNVAGQLRGVRFIFNQTATGAIFLGNVRFVHTFGVGVDRYPLAPGSDNDSGDESESATGVSPAEVIDPEEPEIPDPAPQACELVSAQHFTSLPTLGGAPGWELEFFSPFNFPSRNQMPVMEAENGSSSEMFTLSYHPSFDTNGLIFALSDSDYESISSGSEITVQYGIEPTSETWSCGTW